MTLRIHSSLISGKKLNNISQKKCLILSVCKVKYRHMNPVRVDISLSKNNINNYLQILVVLIGIGKPHKQKYLLQVTTLSAFTERLNTSQKWRNFLTGHTHSSGNGCFVSCCSKCKMNSCVFCITGKEFDIAPERCHDRSSVWGPCSVNTLTTAPASPSVRPAGSWWSCSQFLDEKKQQSVRIVDFFFRWVTKILMWSAVVSWEHDARPCASSSTHANYISLKCFLWLKLKSAILNLDEVATVI